MELLWHLHLAMEGSKQARNFRFDALRNGAQGCILCYHSICAKRQNLGIPRLMDRLDMRVECPRVSTQIYQMFDLLLFMVDLCFEFNR
jgi:hypothetical protein